MMKYIFTLTLLALGLLAQAQIPSFTKIGPNVGFYNVIKRSNGNFVASANQDVFEFSGLNGTFNSLNFTGQLGSFRCISELLGENNNNEIFRSTCDNGIYKYSSGQWSFNSLSGYGTGGQFWNKLPNGRLIFTKGGYLRNIYYSDNNGASWTSAGLGDVDWNHLIKGPNNDLFAVSCCGGYGGKGLIKSTNNGTSWSYINANVPLSTANCVFSNAQNLFVIGDNTVIKKSNDSGINWTSLSNTPNGENGQDFVQFGKYYFLYTYSNGAKLYYSDTTNINWVNISSSLASNMNGMRLKVIDNILFAATDKGLFYFQNSNPCNLSVSLSASDTLAACGTPPTLNAGNAGATYSWNTGDSSQTITANTTGWYSVTVSQNGCSATDSVYVNLLKVDLGNDTTVCRNKNLTISLKNIFSIGDIGPAGGLIFYDKKNYSDDWQYLEASPFDIGNAPWGCFGRVIGSTFDSIGLGDSNTNQIIQNCGTNTAANIAKNFSINGFSDWYLPSILELEKIIQNVYQKGLGNFNAPNGQYWSSSEAFSIGSKIISISNGNYSIGDDNKQWSDFIRACRKVNNKSIFTSILWSTGDTTPSITVTPSQTTTYYCTVSDGISTCTDSVTVFVTSPPVLSLPDTLRSSTRPVVLQPGAAAQYAWSTGDTTASLSVNTAGMYSLTAANAAGCSASDTCLVLFSNPAPAVATPIGGRFNYQASVMDLLGKPMANRTLSVRFSISDSSSINYVETQSVTTDARGHFATQVGSGTVAAGSLDNISWWDGLSRALRTEIDTTGSGSWMQLGSSSLVAVPFSMYALRSGDGSRSVYGSFDGNGTVVSGRGFSVTPLGNGRFEIEFQQPFSEMPNIYIKSTGNGNYSEKIISKFFHKTILEVLGNPDQIQFEAKGK